MYIYNTYTHIVLGPDSDDTMMIKPKNGSIKITIISRIFSYKRI